MLKNKILKSYSKLLAKSTVADSCSKQENYFDIPHLKMLTCI